MNRFDKLSSRYRSTLDRDVRLSGENADYFARYKSEYIKKYLGPYFNGSILDYGCGVGLVAKSLINDDNNQIRITGFDSSVDSVEVCRRSIAGAKFTADFKDIENECFDAAIMANVLHHLKADERKKALKQVVGLLNKGGYIFIFEHNPYNPVTRVVVSHSPIDKDAHLIALRGVIELFNELHINVCKTSYIVFFPRFLKSLRHLESAMGRIPIGAQYACVGKV